MKLYYAKRSPYARKARVLVLEKKLNVEFVEADLTNKPADLLRANPLGKVPTLVLDDGRSVYDSPVVCEILDGLGPEPRMIPADPARRIDVKTIEALADGLMDTAIAAYMEKIRHPKDFDSGYIRNLEKAIHNGFAHLQDNLKKIDGLHLGSIAAACAVGYINFRLPALGPAGHFPRLTAWFEEFSKRASMQATVPSS